jgi:hypothetical protein
VTRRHLVASTILGIGLVAALAVYATATPVVEDPDVYDMEHSKRSDLELERIGGKAALLGNQIDEWVASLWQGRNLAYTIAAITLLVTGAYWLATRAAEGDEPRDTDHGAA